MKKCNIYHIVDVTDPEIWLQTVVDKRTLENAENANRISFLDLVVDVGSVGCKVRRI